MQLRVNVIYRNFNPTGRRFALTRSIWNELQREIDTILKVVIMKQNLFLIGSIFALTVGAVHAQEVQDPQGPEIYYGTAPTDNEEGELLSIPTPSSVNQHQTKGIARKARAQGLQYLQVAAVLSASGGWESIGAYQMATSRDHGGGSLRVVTEEIGYGNVLVARMNGILLPASANYQNESICFNGRAATTRCSSGQTVVGYRRYWKLDGNQRGTFSYQNTSMNSPWNTMSDSIYIQ